MIKEKYALAAWHLRKSLSPLESKTNTFKFEQSEIIFKKYLLNYSWRFWRLVQLIFPV